ncbi:hypothetical protein GCM10023172_04090 [Hymenobacter ginsengisoli]|uniref:Uncharacterized protein n=1 Tax=Hymenobacter ginsengisoli TaxID=1051626 RepID=A0ABP8PYW8_9BACT|nr:MULTISPECIES: hypothetical protein [unclassified Hymenobacter]MBO2030510.1 hypothetical protein [Hymenobacter sp. BT559]
MEPAYPTTGDLSTAAWLKQFAAALPTYAAKYQIAEAEAAALQRASASFLDELGEQIYRVTQAGLPRQAAALGYRILSHAAYDPADGSALGLECLLEQPAG